MGHPQDIEAVLLVMEGDALDQTGDLLGRGLALRDCGVHVWERFSHGGLGDLQESRFHGDFGCRTGLGRITPYSSI
jgi:hypothetical protein